MGKGRSGKEAALQKKIQKDKMAADLAQRANADTEAKKTIDTEAQEWLQANPCTIQFARTTDKRKVQKDMIDFFTSPENAVAHWNKHKHEFEKIGLECDSMRSYFRHIRNVIETVFPTIQERDGEKSLLYLKENDDHSVLKVVTTLNKKIITAFISTAPENEKEKTQKMDQQIKRKLGKLRLLAR